MKRQVELELVVEDIVSTGKSKNERGEFVYPVMLEPLVMAFFGAPDALYEVITERPIMLLNLIQTNKALEAFISRFEGIWVRMIDALIEKEMGAYASEIYPFFVVERHRKYGTKRVNADFIGFPTHGEMGLRDFSVDYLFDRDPPPNSIFYVAYFDSLTALVMRLLDVTKYFTRPFTWDERLVLRAYIDMRGPRERKYFIARFTDCFLVAKAPGDDSPFTSVYTSRFLRVFSRRMSDHLIEELEEVAGLSIEVCEQFVEALKLITKLTVLLEEEGMVPDAPVLIKLDRAIATPYRALLFDSKQGLCKTPEAQKEFLLDILYRLSYMGTQKERMIEEYGQSLNCALCHCETHSVDPVLMRAFCSEACHSQYFVTS